MSECAGELLEVQVRRGEREKYKYIKYVIILYYIIHTYIMCARPSAHMRLAAQPHTRTRRREGIIYMVYIWYIYMGSEGGPTPPLYIYDLCI